MTKTKGKDRSSKFIWEEGDVVFLGNEELTEEEAQLLRQIEIDEALAEMKALAQELEAAWSSSPSSAGDPCLSWIPASTLGWSTLTRRTMPGVGHGLSEPRPHQALLSHLSWLAQVDTSITARNTPS